jgi:biopolymer transport protein TolR
MRERLAMLDNRNLLNHKVAGLQKADINMVPLIDVLLVLLVILLVAANSKPSASIDLPSVSQSSQVPSSYVSLELLAGGGVRVASQGARAATISAKALTAQLTAMAVPLDRPMLLQAAKGAAYEDVLALVDQLRAAGYLKVGLSVAHKK